MSEPVTTHKKGPAKYSITMRVFREMMHEMWITGRAEGDMPSMNSAEVYQNAMDVFEKRLKGFRHV